MLSSLFLNNPFEKPKSPLKQSYWENRRREQQARPEQTALEPATPVFSQASEEDTFSLTPLPLFESEPSFLLSDSAVYLASSLPAESLPCDSGEGKAPVKAGVGQWFQPFLADVFGLSAPEQSQDSPASATQAQPPKKKALKKQKAAAVSSQEPGVVRNQPRRQAKDDHYLNWPALKDNLSESSESQSAGHAIQEPLSPRALDAKAVSRGASKAGHQSTPKTGQPAGSSPWASTHQSAGITTEALRAEMRALLAADAAPSEPPSELPSQLSSQPSLFEPGRPKHVLSALAQQRAELKAKRAIVLEAYANGQTDGKTLLTAYQVTPRQLRSWVLEFRRQQEAKGIQYPRLSWFRPHHADSGLKRNALTENAQTESALKRNILKRNPETAEATLGREEPPVSRPAQKKSRTQAFRKAQNAQNPLFRHRGELGRFVSINQQS